MHWCVAVSKILTHLHLPRIWMRRRLFGINVPNNSIKISKFYKTKLLDAGIQDISTRILIVDELPKGVMMVMKVTQM